MKMLKHKKFKALAAWWEKEDDEIRPVWLREKVVFLVFIFSILGDSPPKNWFDCVFVLIIHFQFKKKSEFEYRKLISLFIFYEYEYIDIFVNIVKIKG